MTLDLLTLFPPLLAIAIAVALRNVYVALLAALFASEALIPLLGTEKETLLGASPAGAVGSAFFASLDRIVAVFQSTSSTRVLIFALLIGALIAFMRDSGGVTAMAQRLISSGIAKGPRRAELAVAATGTAIFVETNVSLLSAGTLGRPLYDTYKMSRERLAYIIDSTCAPISVLLLLNGWGAYALELIEPYNFDQPVRVVAATVPLNFYALLTLTGVYITAVTGFVFGPMRSADSRLPVATLEAPPAATKARYMGVPVLILVLCTIGFMFLTGNGRLWDGSGSQSILWAISLSVVVTALMLRLDGVYRWSELQEKAFQGIGEMVPLVAVLLFSIALGGSLRALGTGDVVAQLAAGNVPTMAIPAILFAAAGGMAFTTGTSWGTYGILIPIAMPLALATGVPPSLALAAVLGGGVFGDHCSPISDTTIIASVAAGTDHLSHVKTQLPYALLAALGTILLYTIAGVLA